ncbi:hypothetical protein [Cohnella sp. 56]|uniref:hypothetical protein n=1 Tax=Cohnella sp. 56 TaxID=3113722 RepID=UPI0030EABA27
MKRARGGIPPAAELGRARTEYASFAEAIKRKYASLRGQGRAARPALVFRAAPASGKRRQEAQAPRSQLRAGTSPAIKLPAPVRGPVETRTIVRERIVERHTVVVKEVERIVREQRIVRELAVNAPYQAAPRPGVETVAPQERQVRRDRDEVAPGRRKDRGEAASNGRTGRSEKAPSERMERSESASHGRTERVQKVQPGRVDQGEKAPLERMDRDEAVYDKARLESGGPSVHNRDGRDSPRPHADLPPVRQNKRDVTLEQPGRPQTRVPGIGDRPASRAGAQESLMSARGVSGAPGGLAGSDRDKGRTGDGGLGVDGNRIRQGSGDVASAETSGLEQEAVDHVRLLSEPGSDAAGLSGQLPHDGASALGRDRVLPAGKAEAAQPRASGAAAAGELGRGTGTGTGTGTPAAQQSGRQNDIRRQMPLPGLGSRQSARESSRQMPRTGIIAVSVPAVRQLLARLTGGVRSGMSDKRTMTISSPRYVYAIGRRHRRGGEPRSDAGAPRGTTPSAGSAARRAITEAAAAIPQVGAQFLTSPDSSATPMAGLGRRSAAAPDLTNRSNREPLPLGGSEANARSRIESDARSRTESDIRSRSEQGSSWGASELGVDRVETNDGRSDGRVGIRSGDAARAGQSGTAANKPDGSVVVRGVEEDRLQASISTDFSRSQPGSTVRETHGKLQGGELDGTHDAPARSAADAPSGIRSAQLRARAGSERSGQARPAGEPSLEHIQEQTRPSVASDFDFEQAASLNNEAPAMAPRSEDEFVDASHANTAPQLFAGTTREMRSTEKIEETEKIEGTEKIEETEKIEKTEKIEEKTDGASAIEAEHSGYAEQRGSRDIGSVRPSGLLKLTLAARAVGGSRAAPIGILIHGGVRRPAGTGVAQAAMLNRDYGSRWRLAAESGDRAKQSDQAPARPEPDELRSQQQEAAARSQEETRPVRSLSGRLAQRREANEEAGLKRTASNRSERADSFGSKEAEASRPTSAERQRSERTALPGTGKPSSQPGLQANAVSAEPVKPPVIQAREIGRTGVRQAGIRQPVRPESGQSIPASKLVLRRTLPRGATGGSHTAASGLRFARAAKAGEARVQRSDDAMKSLADHAAAAARPRFKLGAVGNLTNAARQETAGGRAGIRLGHSHKPQGRREAADNGINGSGESSSAAVRATIRATPTERGSRLSAAAAGSARSDSPRLVLSRGLAPGLSSGPLVGRRRTLDAASSLSANARPSGTRGAARDGHQHQAEPTVGHLRHPARDVGRARSERPVADTEGASERSLDASGTSGVPPAAGAATLPPAMRESAAMPSSSRIPGRILASAGLSRTGAGRGEAGIGGARSAGIGMLHVRPGLVRNGSLAVRKTTHRTDRTPAKIAQPLRTLKRGENGSAVIAPSEASFIEATRSNRSDALPGTMAHRGTKTGQTQRHQSRPATHAPATARVAAQGIAGANAEATGTVGATARGAMRLRRIGGAESAGFAPGARATPSGTAPVRQARGALIPATSRHAPGVRMAPSGSATTRQAPGARTTLSVPAPARPAPGARMSPSGRPAGDPAAPAVPGSAHRRGRLPSPAGLAPRRSGTTALPAAPAIGMSHRGATAAPSAPAEPALAAAAAPSAPPAAAGYAAPSPLRYAERPRAAAASAPAAAMPAAGPAPAAELELRRQPRPAAEAQPPAPPEPQQPPQLSAEQLQQAVRAMPELDPERLADTVYTALMRRMKFEQRLSGY